jgi:hypothetical protein
VAKLVDQATIHGALVLFYRPGSYVPGGAAAPVIKPAPEYEAEGPPPTWFERTFENRSNYAPSGAIAVFYVNNSAASHPVAPDGIIPNFIPSDFKPDAIIYHQLTPDGVLR